MRLADGEERKDPVPRLAAGCDVAALQLTPTEGYLLSRIDGQTSYARLRQLGGMPPRAVEQCLERWIDEGIIEVEGRRRAPKRAAAPSTGPAGACEADRAKAPETGPAPAPDPGAPPAPREADGLAIDPGLDLDVEIQRQVVEFQSRLDRPYHELLGVDRDADTRTIKKAYFALSRIYHPDRYFRRNLGPYAPAVERCFKKLLEAYELLSDPATRREVQRQPEQQATPPHAAEPAAAPAPEAPAAPRRRGPTALEMSRRLRRRRDQLTGHRRIRDERKRKAKGFFEAGMAAFVGERWMEAAGSVRLAIAFDPGQEAYRERFVEVQRKANEERAKQLVEQAEAALELRDYREALDLFEEANHCRPYDGELAYRACRLAWQATGELKRAKEFAASACDLEPENATYRRTLGQIYAAAGLESNARRELQAALRLDPDDKEAKDALKAL